MAGANKKYERVQHLEMFLLRLKVQVKANIEMSHETASLHHFSLYVPTSLQKYFSNLDQIFRSRNPN